MELREGEHEPHHRINGLVHLRVCLQDRPLILPLAILPLDGLLQSLVGAHDVGLAALLEHYGPQQWFGAPVDLLADAIEN